MSTPDPILLEVADGVARVTLDRPARRNALDLSAMSALAGRIDEVSRRDDVRCLVLAGSGGAFCSGADLPEAGVDPAGREENVAMLSAAGRVVTGLVRAPVPVVAEVDGPAAGVGASIALACDLVIASRSSYFVLPFTGIGLIPDGGATLTVAASIGRARAMRMALLQERLPATAAFDAGLIAMVCEPGELAHRTAETVRTLADGATRALARTKAAVNEQALAGLDTALARECGEQLALLDSWEFREGVSAFRERRPPDYTSAPGAAAR